MHWRPKKKLLQQSAGLLPEYKNDERFLLFFSRKLFFPISGTAAVLRALREEDTSVDRLPNWIVKKKLEPLFLLSFFSRCRRFHYKENECRQLTRRRRHFQRASK